VFFRLQFTESLVKPRDCFFFASIWSMPISGHHLYTGDISHPAFPSSYPAPSDRGHRAAVTMAIPKPQISPIICREQPPQKVVMSAHIHALSATNKRPAYHHTPPNLDRLEKRLYVADF